MSPDAWVKLAEPFPDSDIKQRPGRGGMTFSYVDARAVAQRLDDVVTPGGWDFTCSVIPGSDVVKGTLTVGGSIREDHGYPNSDADEEPIKAATSDALKRCAVLFGIGRHLYGDNKPGHRPAPRPPVQAPPRSSTAVPDMPEFPDPEFPDDWSKAGDPPISLRDQFPPIGNYSAPDVGAFCPKHQGEPWRGSPGDLFHKLPSGSGYCRPDGQPKKARP